MIDSYKKFDQRDPRFLYAEDLGDKQVTLKICDIVEETVGDGKKAETKAALVFEGKKETKTLILCKTNLRRLRRLFGVDPRAPIGKEITLASQIVDAFGGTIPAVRIVGAPWLKEPIKHLEQQGRTKVVAVLSPTTARRAATPPAEQPAPVQNPGACSSCGGEGCDRCGGSGRGAA